ncbi:COX15/CtaA family protein [Leucobacter sp. W1153]|uniref:COX15/CtaA family protein n=1 Tax=Leucobacter sp. W1153 TaxID=3439064 RepID=UPI003F35F237
MSHTRRSASPHRRPALPRFLPTLAWASFVANVGIIATGGAVRLTGSGLGCPTWPLCTPESLVPTEEMGIHGIIEFGNRTLTGVLGILAILVFLLVWRLRRERRDLFVLAAVVLVGIVAQAVVGGITVLTALNPIIVGFHYVASVVLVCVTAAFLGRMREQPGPRERVVPPGFAILTHVNSLVLAVTVFVGVLTTGAGPHSGDAAVGRNGFDAVWLSHVHAWPGYILTALTLSLLIWAAIRRLRPLAWLGALLFIVAVQVIVGIYQARNGLPPFAVGVHMVLASLAAAAQTLVILRLKRNASATATN